MAGTTPIHARCHCKTHTFTFDIPNDALPLKGSHCYCNMCRQTNGAVSESYAGLPNWSPFSDSSPPPPTLKYYSATPNARRYFCAKCGTHLFFNYIPTGSWSINLGALTKTGGIVKYKYHIYVAEGPRNDGFGVFSELFDDGLPRYAGDNEVGEGEGPLKSEELKELVSLSEPTKDLKIDPSKRLPISCFCGRVQALLSRPSVHPDNQWLEEFATPDKKKWLGSQDGCESCRLATGAVLTTFIFPPAEHIEWLASKNPGSGPKEDGAGGEDDWRAKAGMTWWRSSNEVIRGFCGTCGAAVHYQCTDREGTPALGDMTLSAWGVRKGDTSDVTVGLLRTSNKDGERLADWVHFIKRLSHEVDLDAYDGALKELLVTGTKKYAEAQAAS